MIDSPRNPALFILAHHDDELFIAATMRAMAQNGMVAVAWLTRGGLGGCHRQAESIRAMELLGISRENLFFFGLPDNRALDYLEEIVPRLVRLIKRTRPASVFAPAYEGGHLDHDTAQIAAATAIRKAAGSVNEQPVLYEFPLYHKYGARLQAVGEFLPGTAPTLQTPLKLKDRLLRQKLARTYKSQKLIIYPLLALKGGPMMLHLRGEPYRRVPAGRDFTSRPHPGRLAYEYYTRRRFEQFALSAASIKFNS